MPVSISLGTLICIALAYAVLGFGLGLFFERLRWNRLIREGKLPRPGQYARHLKDAEGNPTEF